MASRCPTADNYAHWSATVPLTTGGNTLTATVNDATGNSATASVNLTSSPVSPVIAAVASGPTSPTYLDPVTVLAQVAPGATPLANVQLSV